MKRQNLKALADCGGSTSPPPPPPPWPPTPSKKKLFVQFIPLNEAVMTFALLLLILLVLRKWEYTSSVPVNVTTLTSILSLKCMYILSPKIEFLLNNQMTNTRRYTSPNKIYLFFIYIHKVPSIFNLLLPSLHHPYMVHDTARVVLMTKLVAFYQ